MAILHSNASAQDLSKFVKAILKMARFEYGRLREKSILYFDEEQWTAVGGGGIMKLLIRK